MTLRDLWPGPDPAEVPDRSAPGLGPGRRSSRNEPGRRCYHPGMDLIVVLVIVLVVVIVWRGPKTLPLLGKAFGQGVKEARKEIDGMKSDTEAKDEDKTA
jgi:hypothetical protein